ncbi:MAG: nucleotidyltransferase family protein [Lachnospiraceae bacterium]|nr:nucleotidyltransferase family protein [Lachnospiraceae bacterium]
MTPEQSYFISLLRDYVHDRPSVAPEKPLSWEKIAEYAAGQDLSGIIYYQTRGFLRLEALPENVTAKLKEGFFSDAYRAASFEYEFGKIAAAFRKKRIRCLPFKGAVLRDYYPQRELRTMGDRDILIRHEDREASDRAMRALGYRKYVDNHAVWTYTKGILMFEIHDVMFYDELANRVDYREYFSHIWDGAMQRCTVPEGSTGECAVPETEDPDAGSYEYIPDHNTHFLYLVAHAAKHIIHKGMGFRSFLDMVFYAKGEPSLDWVRIAGELKKLELYDFAKTCFSLCELWFDVKMPFRQEEADTGFLEEISEKTFRDGLFGLENEENAASGSARIIKRSEGSYGRAVAGLTLRKLFPPYRDMQLIPWYSWVDGKPWLLPAAWVYRWFYCLFNKRGSSQEALLEPFKKKEAIENREKYLERWGL